MPNYKIVPVYIRSNSRQNITKESWWDVRVYESKITTNIEGCTIEQEQLLVTIENCETQDDAITCAEHFIENNLDDLERWTGNMSGEYCIAGDRWIKEIKSK